MPGERLSIRDNAAVGRFHGVSASKWPGRSQKGHTESKMKERRRADAAAGFGELVLVCFQRQNSSCDVSGDVDGVAAGDGENEGPKTPLTPTGDT